MIKSKICLIIPFALFFNAKALAQHKSKPNVIIIYSDDVGYGDVSCYGANRIQTPNIDKIAKQGIRFTNAHATSSTCTPSRYGLLTGNYPWRKKGTGIAAGDAGSIIDENQFTLGDLFENAGYQTAVIGKWHLGLGGPTGPDWNGSINPSPNDLGFNYSFIIPATPDRVPCVYVENHQVLNLDPKDPIEVSYQHPIGVDPIGTLHPELLKVKADLQHSGTIISGISRIGYMKGGHRAYWIDNEMSDEITNKALNFIKENKQKSFFLYFAIQDIHVPRVPNERFRGKSGMGARGDALLELDENTGKILHLLDSLQLVKNTIIIFSSDNGPVLNDGYQDSAKILLTGHDPSGPYKGWKYGKFDAGTRVPMIISWPGIIKAGEVSDALIGQNDFLASMANLLHFKLPKNVATDSKELLKVLLGKSKKGRESFIEQGLPGLAILKGNWKYIPPSKGAAILKEKDSLETGNSSIPQLYNLKDDISETRNLASKYPGKVEELSNLLVQIEGEAK